MKKTMQSTIKAAAMLMMAAAMTAGMASCSNDDDDFATPKPSTITQPTTTVKIDGAMVALNVKPTKNLRKGGETILEFLDENGKLQSDTVKGGVELYTQLQVSKLPAEVTLIVKQRLLPGTEISKGDKVTFGAMVIANAKGTHGKSQTIGMMQQVYDSDEMVVRGDSVSIMTGQVVQVFKKTLVLTAASNGMGIEAVLK